MSAKQLQKTGYHRVINGERTLEFTLRRCLAPDGGGRMIPTGGMLLAAFDPDGGFSRDKSLSPSKTAKLVAVHGSLTAALDYTIAKWSKEHSEVCENRRRKELSCKMNATLRARESR